MEKLFQVANSAKHQFPQEWHRCTFREAMVGEDVKTTGWDVSKWLIMTSEEERILHILK